MKTIHGNFFGFAALLIAAIITLAGCPNGGPGEDTNPTVDSVTVTPATADVGKGGTQTFTAAVTGTNNPTQTVTWSVTGGGEGTSIENGVLTVAANEPVGTTLTVKATSTVDPSKFNTATVMVTGPGLYIGTGTSPVSDAVTTLGEALTWLSSNAENNASYTIRLDADEELAPTILNSASLNSRTGVSITLTTVGATPRTVQLKSKGSLFTVYRTFTLTLAGHVVIKGIPDNDAALIYVDQPQDLGGTLNLKDNAKITGNTTSDSSGGSSGGVRINDGVFVMTGGEISDNHVS